MLFYVCMMYERVELYPASDMRTTTLPLAVRFQTLRSIRLTNAAVSFFSLKTAQRAKGNNADSKKYTLSAQCLHRSRIFTFLN